MISFISAKNIKSFFYITLRDFQFLFSSNYAEVNVSEFKLTGLRIGYFYICLVKLLHVFLAPLAFPLILQLNFVSAKMYV